MIFSESTNYKHNISNEDEFPEEWKILLKWIGNEKTVLETGCHTGDLSRILKQRKCRVTGMEINASALQEAMPYLVQGIVGNLESPSAWDQLGDKKFQVILFEHVLEHLTDPWQVLSNSKKYLEKNGMVIIALPNISNAKSRFDMLFGKFEYEEIGVMDKTHLRFFNQKTIRELIDQTGLSVDEYASPWRINPIREFIDHLPLLTHFRVLFSKTPLGHSLFSNNLTDVVMLFRCSS